jgi:hypothetical protein
MKKPRWGAGVRGCLRARSALAEVEGGGGAGAEGDFHALAVVGVHGEAGRGQNHGNGEGTALGVVDAAAADNAVDVELHLGTSLRALDHVLDHAAGEAGVVVCGVHGGRTRAIGEAGDVGAERCVLAGGLTDGGDVDLRAGDLEAPLADGANGNRGGVVDLEDVGRDGGAVIGEINSSTTQRCRDDQGASSRGIRVDVVGGGRTQRVRQGAGARSAGLGVDDAEFHRIAGFEIQVGLDRHCVGRDVDSGLGKSSRGCCRCVVEGAGGARKDGGHRKYLGE